MSAYCDTCKSHRLFASSATGLGLFSGVDKPRCQTCGTPATTKQILKDAMRNG